MTNFEIKKFNQNAKNPAERDWHTVATVTAQTAQDAALEAGLGSDYTQLPNGDLYFHGIFGFSGALVCAC